MLFSDVISFQSCSIAIAIFWFTIGLLRHIIFDWNRFYQMSSNLIYIRTWVIQTNPLFIPLMLSLLSMYILQCKELQSNIWSAELVAWPLSIFGFPVASLCKILNQHLKFTFHPVFVWYFCGSEDKGTIWFPSEGKLNSLWPHNLQSLCSSKENSFFTLCNMFLSSIFCSLFRFEMIWT